MNEPVTICEDCERIVNHYFCEHCGSVRLTQVGGEAEAAAPSVRAESPFARLLRWHRGDLTGEELVRVIRRGNEARKLRGSGE